MRHSLPWPGHGDIDSVATAPTGITFIIETKTARYDHGHLARTRQAQGWLARRHGRGANMVIPVLCVVRAHHLETTIDGVLVVSLERLTAALRARAGMTPRPAFLPPHDGPDARTFHASGSQSPRSGDATPAPASRRSVLADVIVGGLLEHPPQALDGVSDGI